MDCTGAPVGVQVFDADREGPAEIASLNRGHASRGALHVPGFPCAEVTNDSTQNTVYYSDEYGPNPLRTATSPENSMFFAFNVPAGGPYDFTATVDETEETESTLPQVFASSVTMTYLVYGGEYETNPTPTECE